MINLTLIENTSSISAIERISSGWNPVSHEMLGNSDRPAVLCQTATGNALVEFSNSFFELLHDPALVIDPHSKIILAANQRAFENYSASEASMVGRNALLIWQNYERESKMLREALANGSVKGFETVHRSPEHPDIFVVTNALAVNYFGRPAVLCINHDVTERERNQRSIMLANIEWRETIDSVQDIIILEDDHGCVRRCNRSTVKFLDIDYKQAIGHRLTDLLIPAGANNANFLRDKLWEGALEGHQGWFEIRNHQVASETSTGNLWVHVIKNVTSTRQAKEELLKLYTVIEQASDGTVIIDLNGNIEYVNQIAERLLGCGRESLVGTSITLAKPEIAHRVLFNEIIPHLENNGFWRDTNSIKRHGETFQEELTVSKLVDSEGKPTNYVFIFRDVTETRQLESIAEAVNLMENVGYVFSGIRHELGNPINSVKMALTVLKKNYLKWDNEQVHLFISRCLQELSRVEYLLRTLKNFSLHESTEIEEVDVTEFLEKFCVLATSDFTKRGTQINVEVGDDLKAACDPRALHQVMINLMANAADAVNDRDNNRITIRAWASRNRINIAVEDNGIGMTMKQKENLFKPFYTSKPGGTGLGLVIVRKMLVNMGGTISIESEHDKGTQVLVALSAI